MRLQAEIIYFSEYLKNRNRLINYQRNVESNTDTVIFPGANSEKILRRSKISNVNRKTFLRNLPQDAVQGLNLRSGLRCQHTLSLDQNPTAMFAFAAKESIIIL